VTGKHKSDYLFSTSVSRELVLIVDPDELYTKRTTAAFCQTNLDVVSVHSAEEALKCVGSMEPAVILTEIDLPGNSGFDLCRGLVSNRSTAEIPVIFVTTRKDEVDRVVGFELGATDYVIKPVNQRELTLRVLRILQRRRRYHRGNTLKTMRIGRLVIDFEQAIAHRNGKQLTLSPTEFQILAALARAQGRVLTRDEIITRVWHHQTVMARTVDAHIKSLRRKLHQTGFKVTTIRGTGYCLRCSTPISEEKEENSGYRTTGGSRIQTETYGQQSDRE
jgi:DNA-binding response OmpR family regulator